MKAALVSAGVPPSHIIDLAHDLPAHGVREAAFLLREMAQGFPPGTVHLVVVDPGVGGRRQPIVIATRRGPLLVGPDNGVLVPLAAALGVRDVYRIDPTRLPPKVRVGTTFDGRDLFAPAAARLATGVRPSTLGPSTTAREYTVPAAARRPNGARGEVLHVDRFGNLITNVPTGWVNAGVTRLRLTLGRLRRRTVPYTSSYEALGPRTVGALGSSFGLVEVAVGEGRADTRLGVGVGATVELGWGRPRRSSSEKDNSARPRNRR